MSYSETRYYQDVQQAIAFSGLKLNFFVKNKADILLDLKNRFFAADSEIKLLDVGCGIGLMTAELQKYFKSISGLDIDQDTLKLASELNPDLKTQIIKDGFFPYGDECFDMVIAVSVFHHIPLSKRDGFIREIKRVTKKKGLIVIMEHNPWNPLTRLVVSRCKVDKDAVLLPMCESRQLVNKAALKILENKYFCFFPFTATYLRKIEKNMGRLILGAQYYLACQK